MAMGGVGSAAPVGRNAPCQPTRRWNAGLWSDAPPARESGGQSHL